MEADVAERHLSAETAAVCLGKARGEAEQSAAADEGAKDTALLTLRPHQTCSEQLAD